MAFRLSPIVTKSVPFDPTKHPRDAGKFSSAPGRHGEPAGPAGRTPSEKPSLRERANAARARGRKERADLVREQLAHAKRVMADKPLVRDLYPLVAERYIAAIEAPTEAAAYEALDFPRLKEEVAEHIDNHVRSTFAAFWEAHPDIASGIPIDAAAAAEEVLTDEYRKALDVGWLEFAEEDLRPGGDTARSDLLRNVRESLLGPAAKVLTEAPGNWDGFDARQYAAEAIGEHLEVSEDEDDSRAYDAADRIVTAFERHAGLAAREKALGFALPALVTKARRGGLLGGVARAVGAAAVLAGHFDESKHPRGNAQNRGQFARGGGSKKPRASVLSADTPKPARAPKFRNADRRFTRVAPPPSLPGRARPSMPGTGNPPPNLGSPANETEAREHLIWAMGRANILRRQAQAGRPLNARQQREFKLSLSLASRLHAQHFSEEAQARKESGESTDAFGLPTVAGKPKAEAKPKPAPKGTPPSDPRHNPDLDAAFAEPEQAKPRPRTGRTELRPNDLLDEVFGKALRFALPGFIQKSRAGT